MINSPSYDLNRLSEEYGGDIEAIQDFVNSRFLGKELGPIVGNMIEDGVLVQHDIVVTNKMCTEEVDSEDEDEEEEEDVGNSSSFSPAPRLIPLIESFRNLFTSNPPRSKVRSAAKKTPRTWPCLYHQTYYEVNKDYFADKDTYSTLISHPRIVGTATLTPVPNTTIFLLVFQGKIDGLTSSDVVDIGLEPLGHEDLIAQRNVDRRGALCPKDVERECLTCPGLNETGFICNGRGDCIDGVCHCPDNNVTDYCLEGSIPVALPSFVLSLISLFVLLTIF